MIRKETILFLSFALCVLGDGPYAISEQRIKIEHKEHNGHHGELTHVGSNKPEHHEEYAWSYPSYEYSYSVHDPHTHDKKGQHESREGDDVKGEYWLIEPDGRKRTVTYHADKHSGFNAIVRYSDGDHHIYEHHGKKKEDDKQDEGKSGEEGQGREENEDNNAGPESEAGPTDEEGGEQGGEEAGEEGRGGQESRGLEGGIVSWGYGPKWNLDSYKGDRYGHDGGRDEERGGGRNMGRDEDREMARDGGRVDERRGRNGGRAGGSDRGRDEVRNDEQPGRDGGRGRKGEDGRNRDEGRKYNIDSLTILENMGSFGHRADDKKKDEGLWRDNKRGGYEGRDEGRDREESLLWEERRKFDQRRGYPSHITPYHGYASRINPRFYRHSQEKRGINTRH